MFTASLPAAASGPAANAVASSARLTSFDVARGLGIILVVFGHALIGVEGAFGESVAGEAVLRVIYAFHMPLFLMLSGLFSVSVTGRSFPGLLGRLGTRIVYPYVLWAMITGWVHVVMSGHTNLDVPAPSVMGLLTAPPTVFWFFYVLFFGFLVAWALRHASAWITVGVIAALMTLSYGANIDDYTYLARFLAWFLVGTLLQPERALEIARSRAVLVAGVIALPCVLWLASQPGPWTGVAYLPFGLPLSLLVLRLSDLIARAPVLPQAADALAWLGRCSLAIYVAHVLFTGGVRIALNMAGFTDRWLVAIVATTAGVLIPATALVVAKRLHVNALLGWR